MPPPFLPAFLSLQMKSKFDKCKFVLFLKSLSVDHASVTQVMFKEFENIVKLLEVYFHTPDININKRGTYLYHKGIF